MVELHHALQTYKVEIGRLYQQLEEKENDISLLQQRLSEGAAAHDDLQFQLDAIKMSPGTAEQLGACGEPGDPSQPLSLSFEMGTGSHEQQLLCEDLSMKIDNVIFEITSLGIPDELQTKVKQLFSSCPGWSSALANPEPKTFQDPGAEPLVKAALQHLLLCGLLHAASKMEVPEVSAVQALLDQAGNETGIGAATSTLEVQVFRSLYFASSQLEHTDRISEQEGSFVSPTIEQRTQITRMVESLHDQVHTCLHLGHPGSKSATVPGMRALVQTAVRLHLLVKCLQPVCPGLAISHTPSPEPFNPALHEAPLQIWSASRGSLQPEEKLALCTTRPGLHIDHHKKVEVLLQQQVVLLKGS
ncbi:hypothetical protein DUNSADRAFT_10926 [Dunaliella salina]|uniref:Uncharacterized protein n=1 Tax=Dunaliella salina TaxID=3046 RepID=A0ABQ7GEG8_DUNSA|nr:hypothetical protein DUNSADRAFT_10926 [Dunaliella salina]KAF5833007.1 hypothetical protein DUNSADRAFT_10926 [Dunaliella salina]|eukprot:KAF5833006.1 hypothetical protein DUNSADRAFT_10926 [Dunaliella salina]